MSLHGKVLPKILNLKNSNKLEEYLSTARDEGFEEEEYEEDRISEEE